MIYLDNNATTPIAPEALSAMLQDYQSTPLNPSSIHRYGQKAKGLILEARHEIATFLKVKGNQILFTSGGTESLNLLIHGLLPPHGSILTTKLEHPAVYETLNSLNRELHYLPVGENGAPTSSELESGITETTSLIVLSAANSETGAKIDLEACATVAKSHGIPLIVDGVALLGKELFTIPDGVSGMAFSAHKLHGPKGVGFAYIKKPKNIKPLFHGGNQQMGLRSGTENLGGILGMAKAISLLAIHLPTATAYMAKLRDHFESELMKQFDIEINGKGPRLPNTSNLSFKGVDGENLLMLLDQKGVAASHGSACSSGALEPSRVLQQMGLSREKARSSIRFSLSRMTSEEDIERAIKIIKDLLSE